MCDRVLSQEHNQTSLGVISFFFVVAAVWEAVGFLVIRVSKSYYASFVQEQQLQLPVKGQDVLQPCFVSILFLILSL